MPRIQTLCTTNILPRPSHKPTRRSSPSTRLDVAYQRENSGLAGWSGSGVSSFDGVGISSEIRGWFDCSALHVTHFDLNPICKFTNCRDVACLDALPVKIPPSVTLLVDPRTGTTSVISTRSPGYPFNSREDSFRYRAVWQTADSAVVDRQGFPLCEFSADTLTWDTCYSPPNRADSIDPDSGIPNRSDTFEPSVIVEDTINDRLLFLTFRGYRVPRIWAHDQDTNEWTHIPFDIGN